MGGGIQDVAVFDFGVQGLLERDRARDTPNPIEADPDDVRFIRTLNLRHRSAKGLHDPDLGLQVRRVQGEVGYIRVNWTPKLARA